MEANVEETQSLDLDSQPMAAQVKIKESLKNERFSSDTKNHSILAYWTFVIISGWLAAVVWLLKRDFLSDSVAITLLSTTTINVIGLPAIVLRGYFASDK